MKTYLILFLAIVFETVATSFLKQSEQFTKLVPSVLTVLGYAAAFYCLSVVLKSIPVGIGKSSVSCPLKPSDSAPLKHSTMPP